MTALRQTREVFMRGIRTLMRQPAFLLITIIQPIVWLLLFGALFKSVAEIPGFHGTYIDFFTPGVVVMLALFGAGWSGMAFVEDIGNGVMERMLASPVWRGALNVGWVGYSATVMMVQTVLIVAARPDPRRRLQGRRDRRDHDVLHRCAARGVGCLVLKRGRRARAPAVRR